MFDAEFNFAVNLAKKLQKEINWDPKVDMKVEYKDKNEPVTSLDLEIDKLLHQEILTEFPDDGWISEESTKNISNILHKKSRIWIIDPLDGTKDFIEKTGDFAVSIAFFSNNKPAFGVILFPSTKQIYSAKNGQGAYCNNNSIYVSSVSYLDEIIVAVSKTDKRRELLEGRLPLNIQRNILKIGSTVLKIIAVAQGVADVFYCPWTRNIWDYSAAALILLEAGGYITDFAGKPLNWENLNTPNLLVSNNLVHKEFLEIINLNIE